MRAFLFPGQGTQRPGMGESFYHLSSASRDLFAEAEEVLGYDLTQRCFRGTPELLADTRITQPAVFVVNLAAHAMLRDWGVAPDFVAGHSVGEWSAIVAADMLSFPEGLRMVARRAELMAGVQRRGGMTSILGVDEDVLLKCCQEAGPTAVIAVDNGPQNFVIAGSIEDVEATAANARALGASRVTPLRVGQGFHSSLLSEIRPAWEAELDLIEFAPPRVPIALNVSGLITTSADEVRNALVRQVDSRVRWRECMLALCAAGCRSAVEVGDSRFLRRLWSSIDHTVGLVSLDDLATARRRLAELGAVGA